MALLTIRYPGGVSYVRVGGASKWQKSRDPGCVEKAVNEGAANIGINVPTDYLCRFGSRSH